MKRTFFLLLIATLLFTSCKKSGMVYSDTIPQAAEPYLDTYFFTEDVLTNFSAFNHSCAVIAEFGEAITEANSQNDSTKVEFTEYYNKEKYVAYPIKICKKFYSTAYYKANEDFQNFFPAIIESEKYPHKNITHLNEIADYHNKDQLLLKYDDIILIHSDFSDKISVGEKYLILIDKIYIDFPNSIYDLEEKSAAAWTVMSEHYTKKPFLISIKDEKIHLSDRFYDKSIYGSYVNWIANEAENANDRLKQLGLTDNLFRDGMTVDELEEYFDLVTDKNTFAPLFE